MDFKVRFRSIKIMKSLKQVVDSPLMALLQVFDHHDVGMERKRT
jgi:hypothetical protein